MLLTFKTCLFFSIMFVNASEFNKSVSNTPIYIRPCNKSDPQIDKCLRKTFDHLKPYLITGIDEINVPSIDPFKIDEILIQNGNGPFQIKASFYNTTAFGASNFTVERIRTDISKYIIELGVKFPKIEIKGKYDVNGNVLLFPVKSRGDFWAVFVNVEVATRIFGREVKNNYGERYMHIEQLLVDFIVEKSRFRTRDVLNYGGVIGEAINKFLNNNSEEIIKEMKPAANAAISKHFKIILNNALNKLPIETWLPDV